MTTTIHLGVADIAYSDKQAATVMQHWEALKRGKPLSRTAARAAVTHPSDSDSSM